MTIRYESGCRGGFSSTYALFLGHGEPVILDIVGSEILVKILGEKIVVVTPREGKSWELIWKISQPGQILLGAS